MSTILHNGKVYLEREKFAEAVFIENGLIGKVGSNEKILALADDSCQFIDCKGKTVIPGLNDSHLHILLFADSMAQVSLMDCTSIGDIIDRCKTFIAENPKNIQHGLHAIGWNQDLFTDEKRNPNRFDLDKISTDIPIVLERICGHIISTNTKAIETVGIDGKSPQWPGGTFELGSDGYPNGIFTENACNFVKEIIPEFSPAERAQLFIRTMEYAVAHGLTSIQSNDIGSTVLDATAYFSMFHQIFDEDKALLRYRHQVCFNRVADFKEYLETGEYARGSYPEDSWLTLGPLKLFKDGSLGARTAFMRQEYADDSGNFGLEWVTKEEMEQYCQLAAENNLQVITHVIGDAAIEQTIDCYEKAFIDGKNKLRHALVHCQITDRSLLERIARLGILVLYQPVFLDYDMHIVEDRCGKELSSTSYAFKTLHDLGGLISYGTDCPVESCNPFPNLYSAVTRKDFQGNPPEGFYPQECVDIYTAIDAYTTGSAYAEFMEDKKGRIKEGYYADMVILDKDIFTIDPMDIKDILPELTMVGGKIVYQKPENNLAIRCN
ncbi:amidohydrolase [Aminipila butyrica]|uniref:Amidohydrolase n=1 Tax=Aminipila butyrica TaxID=433296 RepID=A0A858BQH8_9FIRM|nr:amidohydrolase [Aminipila butyrica]QIB68121.1 amidohydrolase [Aminipila butyrica]